MQEYEKQNNHLLTLEFYKTLNQQRLLSRWHLFDKLKYRNIDCQKRIKVKYGKEKLRNFYTDKTGGYIHKSQINKIAKQLEISSNTLRQRLSDFKTLGWATKTKQGFILNNWKIIARQFTPKINYIRLKAKTYDQLKKDFAYKYLNTNIRQQVFNKNSHWTKKTHKKLCNAAVKDSEYSVSVRTLARNLGFKSPATGTRYERLLEKDKRIKVIRRTVPLCHINLFNEYIEDNPSLNGKCFVAYDGTVYQRLCNNIIPLNNEISNQAEYILKQAKILLKKN